MFLPGPPSPRRSEVRARPCGSAEEAGSATERPVNTRICTDSSTVDGDGVNRTAHPKTRSSGATEMLQSFGL